MISPSPQKKVFKGFYMQLTNISSYYCLKYLVFYVLDLVLEYLLTGHIFTRILLNVM